ncbi:hypothetical protein HU186_01120 [Bacillus paralicheniformis]|uniref:hypothetical protein n=1 Tax=Bacillus paralicheniformis TaxID=1648923 RepID=UPI001CC69016|nr:hypothetical protein [Bacillus paralicheniformis]MBZ5212955.1 hypothetical protein [Bacillus paralicheniformis]
MGKLEGEFYGIICGIIREKEKEMLETEANSPEAFHRSGELCALKKIAGLYKKTFLSEERRLLIKEASAFHAPDGGPDFNNMPNGQIAQHIAKLEGAFKLEKVGAAK